MATLDILIFHPHLINHLGGDAKNPASRYLKDGWQEQIRDNYKTVARGCPNDIHPLHSNPCLLAHEFFWHKIQKREPCTMTPSCNATNKNE